MPRQAAQEQGPGDDDPEQALRPRGGRGTEVSVRLAFLEHAVLRSRAAGCAC